MEKSHSANARIEQVINICLYCAIPEESQFKKTSYGFGERCKGIIRSTLDAAYTSLTGRLRFDIHSYKVANNFDDNSNRGDMAIRLALRSQVEAAFSPRNVRFTEVKWGDLSGNIANINRDLSLFIIAGGGYISIDGDGSPWAMLANSHILENLKCPIVASGIGINRLMNEPLSDICELPEKTKSIVYQLSALCRKIGVRDLDSVELFASYGQKRAVLIGDPVLFFDGDVETIRSRPEQLKIGVNLAAHGRRTFSMLEPILPDIIEFLSWVQEDRGAQLTYLMHHDFELPVAKYLRRKGLDLEIIDLPARELIGAYKKLDFVINQMLHSCIFAANAEVPFLNIAYDVKCSAFCTSLDIPEFGIDYTKVNVELLKKRFDELFQNRGALTRKIGESKTRLRSEGRAFFNDVVELTIEKEPR